jgi:hypothetical protein
MRSVGTYLPDGNLRCQGHTDANVVCGALMYLELKLFFLLIFCNDISSFINKLIVLITNVYLCTLSHLLILIIF